MEKQSCMEQIINMGQSVKYFEFMKKQESKLCVEFNDNGNINDYRCPECLRI